MNLNEITEGLSPDNLKNIGQAALPIKAIVLVFVFAVVLALGIYKLVMPKIELLEQLGQEEITLKETFKAKQEKAANLKVYEEQLEEMRERFGSMLKSLPDKTEVDNTLVEVSRAASSNNLIIEQFTPTGEVKKDFYAEYPITLRLRGSYTELTGFVSDVAALQRIVTLHNFRLSPSGQKDSGELAISLTAKTYRYLTDGK